MPRNSFSIVGMAGTRRVFSSLLKQVLTFIYISKGPESPSSVVLINRFSMDCLSGINKCRSRINTAQTQAMNNYIIVAAASDRANIVIKLATTLLKEKYV